MSEEENFPEEQTAESYRYFIETEPKPIYTAPQQHHEQKEDKEYSNKAESSEEEDQQHHQPQSQDDSDSDVIEIISGPEDASPARLNKDSADYHSEFESELDAGESEASSQESNSSEEESDGEENYSYSDEEEEEQIEQAHPLINVEARETIHAESDEELEELEDSDIEEIISDDDNGETEQEESEDEAMASVESEAGSISSVVDLQEEPVPDSVNLFASEEYSHLIDPSFSNISSFGAISQPIVTDSLHQSEIAEGDLVSETQLANALQTLANSTEIHHQFHHVQVNHGEDHFVPRSEVDELISKDIVEAVDSISAHSFPADASVKPSIDISTIEFKKPDPIIGVGINGLPIKNLNFHDITIPIKSDTTVNFSFGESFIHKPSTPEPLHEETEKEENTELNDKDTLTQHAVQASEPDQKESADISLSNSTFKSEAHVANTESSPVKPSRLNFFSASIAFGVPTLNSSVGYSFGERFYAPIKAKPAFNTKQNKIIEASSKFGSFAASVWADLSQTEEKPVSHPHSTSIENSLNRNKSDPESLPTEEVENSKFSEKIEEVETKDKSQKEQEDENAENSASPEVVPILDDKEEEVGEDVQIQDQRRISEVIPEDVEMPDIDEIRSFDDGLSLLAQNAFEALGGIESIQPENVQDSDAEVSDKDDFEETKNTVSSVETSTQVQSLVESSSENERDESSYFVDAVEEAQHYDAPTTLGNPDVSSENTDAETYSDVLEPVVSDEEDIELEDQEPAESSMPIDPVLLESADKPSALSEEPESSDESVIFLDEVNAPQESEEEYESESEQSEGNYTLNETTRPQASDIQIPLVNEDILPTGGVSQSPVAESSSSDAIVQNFDEPEDKGDNIDEDDAEKDDGSGSEEAGNHSMFLIDQLNEVESTQVEDSDSSESSDEENDEAILDLHRVIDVDDQPEYEDVILSKTEQEVLDEEIQELAREDPEFNAQELIDQGTPISTKTTQSVDFGIETTRQETIEVRKVIFATVETGSGLEDTKERIPTHLMDNPTSDDYLYEARMEEAATSTSAHENDIQSPESTKQVVDPIPNPPVTVVSIDSSGQPKAAISTISEEISIKDRTHSDGEGEKVDMEVSIIENPTEELQSTPAVSEKIDIATITNDLDTSSSSSSEENVGPQDDDSSSESAFEAENEDAKKSDSEVVKDEETRASAIQPDVESAEGEDNNGEESERNDKENQDPDQETNVIEDDAVEDEAESKPLDTVKSPSIEEQQDAMDVEEDKVIHSEISTHESGNQIELSPQRDSTPEALKIESQEDVEMEEIGQDNEESNHTDQFEQKKEINSFLDRLIESSNQDEKDDKLEEEEEDLQVKDKGNDDNNLAIDTKSHVTSDKSDQSSNEEEREPIVTKAPLRRTRQVRVATKKSAFLGEVIKQQKGKPRNAAAATAKEEKVSPEVASPSPLAATTTSKRSQKERKAKLETTKQKRQRNQSESSTGALPKANSPPHMSLRSGRRIATGSADSTSTSTSGTKPAPATTTTTTTKGGRGKRSEAGNTSKGPVNKKPLGGAVGKRKGRGKAAKR
ncbi:hypothetical protein D0Z00_001749 [Geotrichum galactomycetum]|uniref:Uncharacterized protein n=1 Tax=Geotrichum galactomycetum TaxID=27317 RepID=A0ACB6V607_9ASCO|nr:hypothetical protein D0Z00_001749 [Geotrichum candidum]